MIYGISQVLALNYQGKSWSLTGEDYDGLVWSDPSPKPTEEELNLQAAELNAQEPIKDCKKQASQLLYETDWTTIPDVANPENSPYLVNQADFIAWRNQVRALAVNPVADPIFPTKPNEVWG